MSMTKRYLESLPAEVQDDILGLAQAEEWYESAENEPTEEDLWWARMLMEEGDEQC